MLVGHPKCRVKLVADQIPGVEQTAIAEVHPRPVKACVLRGQLTSGVDGQLSQVVAGVKELNRSTAVVDVHQPIDDDTAAGTKRAVWHDK